MSKAFASNDGESEVPAPVAPPVLPPGTPNFITAAGAQALKREVAQLTAERAKLGDAVEALERKKAIDRALDSLAGSLAAAQVVDLETQPRDRVAFGASVTVRDAAGKTRVWRIVGVDETDLDRGWISWISPLARAMLDKKAGDTAAFGNQRLTILSISY